MLALLFFIIMVILVKHRMIGRSYYVIGIFFLVFAAVFLATAFAYVLRSLMWHIQKNKLGSMLRNYVCAYIGFYVLLMILDHITMGSVSWGHNLLYAMIAAVIQVYVQGYRLEFIPAKTDAE